MSRFPDAPYEIEFRCRFATEAEAYRALPFLEPSLVRSVTWTDSYYGAEIFERGEVLRLSTVSYAGATRYFLSWKGVDVGTFANVRQELVEEVDGAMSDSAILTAFVGDGRLRDPDGIRLALERTGHEGFMSYEGWSRTGRYDPLGLSTKLMRCETLRWPLLVELERSADSETEARRCERDLLDVCSRYGLEDRVVREEPGTLLYESVFGGLPAFLRTS